MEDARREIPEKEGAYPSSKMFGKLPAYGFFCRHAKNLRLLNVALTFKDEDVRPAIVCNDVGDLDVFGLRTTPALTADAVLRLKDLQGALIHGCRPQGIIETFLRVEGAKSSAISLLSNDLRNAHRPFATGDKVSRDAVQVIQVGRDSHATEKER